MLLALTLRTLLMSSLVSEISQELESAHNSLIDLCHIVLTLCHIILTLTCVTFGKLPNICISSI